MSEDEMDGPTMYPCPTCGEPVEHYEDSTMTWCDHCPWTGWGEELRLGQPGSMTGTAVADFARP